MRVNLQNKVAMHSVKHELNCKEIYNKLSKCPKADPILNYSIIHKEIMQAKDKHVPIKIMTFNKCKHKHSAWITQSLLKYIKYQDSLYEELKMFNSNSPNYEVILTNFKTLNSVLKKNIRAAKKNYFELCFNRSKYDIRNTWKIINNILSKNKANKIFNFKENGINITDTSNITN